MSSSSLTCDADESRAAYEAESIARCREGARIALIVAITLIVGFAPLDRVRFPALFPMLLRIRLVAALVLACSGWLLTKEALARHVRVLGACVGIAIGLMFDALMLFTGGAASPYYAGVGLVILGATLLVPWGPVWSAGVSAVIVAGYVVCAMPTAGGDQGHLFLSNLFYLSGTGVLAIVTSAAYERLRWREFTTRRDLVDAYRLRNVFLANMSHELRTPIHVMIGYADILLEGALARGGDEAQMLVEVSRRQGVVLHRLISDLLDFSKIEAGKMELNVEPLDLGVVIAQAAESFRPVAERKGLRFLTTIAELPRVRSDRHRLEQILNNLIGNAVKFTDTGEVRIEVTTAAALAPDLRADLVVLADGAGAPPTRARDGVVIAVTDTGIGIRDADFAKLANDFQQLEGAARYGGTGLGLSFARKLVGLLGGVMMVRSRAGEGSTFAVFLPAEESAPQRQPAPAAA